jgi:hypothetical protein
MISAQRLCFLCFFEVLFFFLVYPRRTRGTISRCEVEHVMTRDEVAGARYPWANDVAFLFFSGLPLIHPFILISLPFLPILLPSSLLYWPSSSCARTHAAPGFFSMWRVVAAACHAMPYHTIPYRNIPLPNYTISYHDTPYHTIPYHYIPCHTIPRQSSITRRGSFLAGCLAVR